MSLRYDCESLVEPKLPLAAAYVEWPVMPAIRTLTVVSLPGRSNGGLCPQRSHTYSYVGMVVLHRGGPVIDWSFLMQKQEIYVT